MRRLFVHVEDNFYPVALCLYDAKNGRHMCQREMEKEEERKREGERRVNIASELLKSP